MSFKRSKIFEVTGQENNGIQNNRFPPKQLPPTDKETDEFWDIFMKNQFWAGLGSQAILVKKKLELIMSNF